jgi:AcrR family transcriptional regulator
MIMRTLRNSNRDQPGEKDAAGRVEGSAVGQNKLAAAHLFVKWIRGGTRWCVGMVRGTLGRMGRHKTVSDDEVLRAARGVFRAKGHTATTREIAEAVGISEAVLYQRFGSKDELFFAAMHPTGPDVEEVLGPPDPPGDGRTYLREVVTRAGRYFAEVIPLALRLMMHPAFNPASLSRVQPRGPAILQEGLARRLASLARRKQLAMPNDAATARLLLSLAHDWALGLAFQHGEARQCTRDLEEMVDVVWMGLRIRGSAGASDGGKRT